MSIAAYEGTVENGRVKLTKTVHLPEHACVYVLVTGVAVAPGSHLASPHLAQPERAVDFIKEAVDESGGLPLDDPRWPSLPGGYRIVYDASPALRKLLADGASDELWEELWNNLHHQGDVDRASYAAVPWLVEFVRRSPRLDANALALIAVIELERPKHRNPEVRPELSGAYFGAIRSLPAVLGTHPDQEWTEDVLRGAAACLALARGQRWFARAYFELDWETAGRWFSAEFGWDFGDN